MSDFSTLFLVMECDVAKDNVLGNASMSHQVTGASGGPMLIAVSGDTSTTPAIFRSELTALLSHRALTTAISPMTFVMEQPAVFSSRTISAMGRSGEVVMTQLSDMMVFPRSMAKSGKRASWRLDQSASHTRRREGKRPSSEQESIP